MNQELLAQLLEPIPGDDICGIDVSYSTMFDEIREARRQDDPCLAQGEWETELKIAQWPRVRELTEEILSRQSKDMQVAAWFIEAMTRLKGFDGLATGLQVMDGLVNEFWEFCYPSYDPDDLEERAGKIEWLNKQMPLVIREIALTDRASGGYSWLKWEESRAIDNLGLKDIAAKEKAVASGKLSGEAFDKAVQTSGRGFYEKLQAQVQEAVAAALRLEKRVDERFGDDAPSLKELRSALQSCEELVGKLLSRLGGGRSQVDTPVITEGGGAQVHASQLGAITPVAVGLIVNRGDAIHALREVARYFRQNEPHSPVAFLAERAANWAEMPLEKWLEAVVKDQSTLGQLRELLDIRQAG
ncbi:MAG: type VI secretion system protein TssA [Rhodocyclales bacterium GT-UBC]|nr:MAG: type VI secretion system protein TssA [Rhodocyclales bacterium GT-UBC]